MAEIYVVNSDDYDLWRSQLAYNEYNDPKGYEGVKYIRSHDACSSFEAQFYSVSVEQNDEVAEIIERITGEYPRLYSMQEAQEILKSKERELERLRDRISPSLKHHYGLQEATPPDDEFLQILSERINKIPTFWLQRSKRTEYGQQLET